MDAAEIAHRHIVAHWYLKVGAMWLLVGYIYHSNVRLAGNGGPEVWLNRTPHVVVSAPLGDGSLCGLEIGP